MDTQILQRLGLTNSQAKSYAELIKAGSLTPPQLAAKTKESRTAAYMALAKLEEIGLATKVGEAKKATYSPANPSALEKFIAAKRKEVSAAEDLYRASLPRLLTYYYSNRGEPGIRFYQGKEGLTKIYEDHLRTGQDVYFVRTMADEEYFGDVLYQYMNKRAKQNITAHGLAPYTPGTYEYAQKNDKELKRDMAWFPPKAYTAPVEISIYGDKVSLISFGKEAIGTIIESPQIAQALRELFAMAKLGAKELMNKKA
ncbi:MAG TPA: helix-turn-helix domain-containing protein [Candidatus Saccharimonadales bacterium]|nr:helix-turn-helix domain-containing protein [Candidatus Saccharimonadales bacterium]